ncbi:DUF7793 family protein [Curvivirga aplysinae]|uniref:DUF7793 family protein n=1 Tax=Curvivirga aplysinae TaxID=2529852 RepID=UPI0012BD709F|nr:hypothetical protein [Curvivirga aplysinae]MTI08579.1 hypothetical protein [Curvivirga aplysinae]
MISDRLRVYLDNDIVIIDFGMELVSVESMTEAIRMHEKLTGIVKCKVIIISQGALDLDGGVKELSASERVVKLSEAVAIVPTTKLGFVLAALFMKIMKNPFPTKVFSDVEQAKEWLNSEDY